MCEMMWVIAEDKSHDEQKSVTISVAVWMFPKGFRLLKPN